MFEKVLAALDFSNTTPTILSRICEIPGIREVVLLHVVDATHPSRHGWTHGPDIENAKIILTEKKTELEKLGLKVHIHVDVIVSVITEGDIAHAVLEAAELHQVSLIVIGARGINPIKDLLLGSVSSSVLRHATSCVLVMHDSAPCPPQGTLFSRILVPTDFSKPAGDTLSLVAALPGIQEIFLLHVISSAGSTKELDELVAENRARLDETAKDLSRSGISATPRIRIGDPETMILSVANEDAASLIVMNAFGTGLLREMLLGSTTFSVVRRAKSPVLVVRTGCRVD